MATNNAHSDLIHLFIDGEATETERNALFGALKDSPELQEEFSSAMELKKAFAADIMQLQPPSYLQSQIAERAGLIVAASASVATAPVVVNSISSGISSALSSAAPIATTAVSKGLITLAVGTSLGILSTIGVIRMTSNNDAKDTKPVAEQGITRQMQPTQMPQLFTQAANAAPVEMSKAIFKNSSQNASQKAPAAGEVTKQEQITPASTDDNVAEEKSSINSIPATPAIVDNKESNAPVVDNATLAFNVLNPITPTEVRIPTSKAIGDNGTNRGLIHGEDMLNMGSAGYGRWSAQVTGILTSRLYQGIGSDALKVPMSENLGFGVKYDLDPMSTVRLQLGAEFGREKFPIYLSNGNGGYDNYRSITWYGVSLTYSAVQLEVLNFYPEFRVLGGLGNAGPIGKYSAGIVRPITSALSLSVDAEETMLFIQSNGANLTGNKLALTGSLIFHF